MTLRAFLTRLILLSVTPLALLAIWLTVAYVRDEQAGRDDDTQRMAKNIAGAVDQRLGIRIAALQLLAASPLAAERVRWPDLYAQAQGFRRSFNSNVVFAGPDGQVRFHTGVDAGEGVRAPLPPALVAVAKAAVERKGPAVGDALDGHVAVAVPGTGAGSPPFVVLALLDAAEFERQLGVFTLPQGAHLELHDSRGVPIARQPGADAVAEAGMAPRRFEAQLAAAPWSVALTVPAVEQMAPWVRLALAIGLAVLGATALGIAWGSWASRRLARSMAWLADTGAATMPPLQIAEVSAARHRLDETAQALQRAESDRRDSEHQFASRMAQAAHARRLSEAQLRALFDAANDGILTTDEAQIVRMANPAAARMFGFGLDEMIGAPLEQLVPERFRAQHRADVQTFGVTGRIASHPGRDFHVNGRRRDGEEFPVDASISRVEVDGERMLLVILRDVTERRRTEEALVASKAKLEAAMASMSDAVAIWDADGGLIEFNEAFAHFYRFARKEDCPRDQARYHDLVEVCAADGTAVSSDRWVVLRALRGERGTSVEFGLRRKDTGQAWFGSFSFAPIRSPGGEITAAVVSARDITELKQAMADLEASHATLRRVAAAQDRVQEDERRRIARELHDDLQQTLAAIMIEAGAMRAEPAPAPARVAALLARVDSLAAAAIDSTRRIVNDLRPQMLEELGLAAALEALALLFSHRTGIDCTFATDEAMREDGACPEHLMTCLYRVAQESLNNVVKHSRARHVEIELLRVGSDRLLLRVADDGIGLTGSDLGKSRSYGLLGMSERVRAVGGALRIAGQPGAGTRLEVEVPIAPGADAHAE